jgi:hypothetical protein
MHTLKLWVTIHIVIQSNYKPPCLSLIHIIEWKEYKWLQLQRRKLKLSKLIKVIGEPK